MGSEAPAESLELAWDETTHNLNGCGVGKARNNHKPKVAAHTKRNHRSFKRAAGKYRHPYLHRRLVGKGIPSQQSSHCGLVFKHRRKEARKPRQTPRVIECGEPYLPVQARLVHNVPARAARPITALVPKLVFAPRMHSETDLSDIWDNVLTGRYPDLTRINRDDPN